MKKMMVLVFGLVIFINHATAANLSVAMPPVQRAVSCQSGQFGVQILKQRIGIGTYATVVKQSSSGPSVTQFANVEENYDSSNSTSVYEGKSQDGKSFRLTAENVRRENNGLIELEDGQKIDVTCQFYVMAL